MWNRGSHNAFPDIGCFGGDLYGACREGTDHMSRDGRVVVIKRSENGEWEPVITFERDGFDLRDAKLSETPDGRLMCLSSLRPSENASDQRRAFVWFSENGTDWTEGTMIGEPKIRIWDVTWNVDTGYGVGYSATEDKFIRLYKTTDGARYSVVAERMYDRDFPNETVLGFPAPDRSMALCRRNRGDNSTTVMGTARAPYTDWNWSELGVLLGGPNLIQLPSSGQWIAGGRVTTSNPYTGLLEVHLDEPELELLYSLSSNDDNGYPGFCLKDDRLWILYYSTNAGGTHLREASVPLSDL